MQSTSPLRLAAGILCIFPLSYCVYVLPTAVSLFTSSPPVLADINRFVLLSAISLVPCFAALTLCVVQLFRSGRVPQSKQALWLLALIFGSVLALPIFWYLYVRPSN